MFKQRLLTTLVLLPLVLAIIYCAPAWMLVGVLLLLIGVSSWEWAQLIPFERTEYKLMYLVAVQLVIWLVALSVGAWLVVGSACWLLILCAVLTYPHSQSWWGYPLVVGGLGVLLLPIFANVMMGLYQTAHGQDLMVYVLSLVWAADIGAYLAGKRWGRHKLIPKVSPGKTLEGSAGGVALVLLVALIGYTLFKPESAALWFLTAFLTALISILGDLLISLLKRRSQLKDSGHILPGHGGMLDRLDSSIAALPLFYMALSCLELGR